MSASKRRKTIPALERWQRDRNPTGRVLGVLAHLVTTCPWYELERVEWDIENWQIELDRAKAALAQRHADDRTREKIANLRNKTEANGCTPAEARAAVAMADKLEGKLPPLGEGN